MGDGGVMDKAKVLERAAEVVEERGWTTGNSGMRPAGPVCVLGACSAALDELYPELVKVDRGFGVLAPRYQQLRALSFYTSILRVVGEKYDKPYKWNDSLDFDDDLSKQACQKKVASVLREAARLEREESQGVPE